MKTLIFATEQQASRYAAETVAAILKKKPDAVLCLAAGHTSIPVFDALIERKVDFSQARFIGLDEWAGVPKEQEGSCAYFLEKHFFSRIQVKPEQMALFDAMAEDLDAECEKMEGRLKVWGGMDYLLLGMGMNGHLALNEPGDGFDRTAHPVTLSAVTLKVAPKYFPADMPPITKGLTFGIGTLLKARCIQLAVFGAHKQAVVKELLTENVRESLPASALYLAENPELLLDELAANVKK